MIHVFRRKRARLGLVPLRKGLLHAAEVLQPGAVQLRLGETVPAGALQLGEHRGEADPDPRIRNSGTEAERLGSADQGVPPGPGADEGRIGLLGQLVEPLVENPGGHILDQLRPPGGDGSPGAGRPLHVHRHRGAGGLGVGGNGHFGRLVRGNRGDRPGSRRGRLGNAGESLLDQRLDLPGVKVAHRHNRHQIGTVPVPVEAADRFGGAGLDALGRPDR